ncbi:chemotaxis protein MotB [Clostridium sartagoforme]|uniref:Chemotaxis protein MotB n=1 Tax=Clostridium sartagoforme TaxID=84031 RepID=A0A4S2DI08_9CLOT|nr:MULTISPECIES: OmpA family protein [Clostridium]MBS5938110.1 OmpA family protein [Clostridium sp.]TGY40454.1 chemotaxis protein MotB [Clostridium sartagoforme]
MKKRKEKPENSERWLLTYSDLITLLMVFFVVLYSASNINQKKYEKLASSMNSAFTGGTGIGDSGEGGANEGSSDEGELKPLVQSEEEKLQGIEGQVDEMIKEMGLEGSVSTSIEERGLVISFNDSIFFESAKAEIMEDMKLKLVSLSTVLNKIDNYIRIEGHTDNVPIRNEYFSSNWQLSSTRASNVVEYLINNGGISPDRLSAVGYGEYRPVADNSTNQGRSKNRRVDILILNNKYDNIENNN